MHQGKGGQRWGMVCIEADGWGGQRGNESREEWTTPWLPWGTGLRLARGASEGKAEHKLGLVAKVPFRGGGGGEPGDEGVNDGTSVQKGRVAGNISFLLVQHGKMTDSPSNFGRQGPLGRCNLPGERPVERGTGEEAPASGTIDRL
eukprot:GGOE01046340.1.p3 GENE.GGOE01046340.1~~GGOE01046340.1.p3  ORF type:complete len:146 (+),score=3.48 GGOE01046340.1:220-657(+)